jgi:hypothetical protein
MGLPISTGIALDTEDFLPTLGLTSRPLAVALVPNANKRSPSERILIAAFTSLSCLVLQLSQAQLRTSKGRLPT